MASGREIAISLPVLEFYQINNTLEGMAYDANDNLTSAADSNGTVTYSYDQRNQVQSYANVFGQVCTLRE
jgi:YD repeat-containing protein